MAILVKITETAVDTRHISDFIAIFEPIIVPLIAYKLHKKYIIYNITSDDFM